MKRINPASQNFPPAPFREVLKSGKTVLFVVDVSDKQIQEILDQNQIILQENAKLRKQMNELLTELTKVKHEEKQDN